MSATAMTPIKMKKNGPELFLAALFAADEGADDDAGEADLDDDCADDLEEEGIEDGETTPRVGTSGIVTFAPDALAALFLIGRFDDDRADDFLAAFLAGRFATAFLTVFFAGRFAADFFATFLTAFLTVFFAGRFAGRFAAFFAATGMTPCRVTHSPCVSSITHEVVRDYPEKFIQPVVETPRILAREEAPSCGAHAHDD